MNFATSHISHPQCVVATVAGLPVYKCGGTWALNHQSLRTSTVRANCPINLNNPLLQQQYVCKRFWKCFCPPDAPSLSSHPSQLL